MFLFYYYTMILTYVKNNTEMNNTSFRSVNQQNTIGRRSHT